MTYHLRRYDKTFVHATIRQKNCIASLHFKVFQAEADIKAASTLFHQILDSASIKGIEQYVAKEGKNKPKT
jgi:hypothetical protein